jgi:phosphoglycolate phosphatase
MTVPPDPSAPRSSPVTLVFDLDGTLADTAEDLVATLNVILARENVPPVPVGNAGAVIGAGARAMIERGLALGGVTVDEARLGDLFRDFLEHYGDNLVARTSLYPGAESAIEALRREGFLLAVCTNKMERHSQRLLEELGVAHHFGAICGRDSFAWAKPDPRHLTLTIEKAGGDPARAVMIGDSRTDVETARAAGLPVVAVTFGYTDRPVAEYGPDVLIDHFDDLCDALAKVGVR